MLTQTKVLMYDDHSEGKICKGNGNTSTYRSSEFLNLSKNGNRIRRVSDLNWLNPAPTKLLKDRSTVKPLYNMMTFLQNTHKSYSIILGQGHIITHRFVPARCGSHFNSLAPGKFEWNFRYVIFKQILVTDSWGISCEIVQILTSLMIR